MPSYYTHHYFAEKLLHKLPYSSRAVADLYPDAYRIGALGLDILRPLGRLRAEMDYKYIFEVFDGACRHIFQNGSKAQLAYVLGLCAHYIADSRINPYIYYFLENGVHKYFDGGKDYLDIKCIRDGIDLHIQKKMNTDSIIAMCSAPLPEVAGEVAELFETAVSETVGYKIKGAKVESCMLGLSIPLPKAYMLNQYDYMNRQKRQWSTVRNGDWMSDMSLEELIDKTVAVAEKLTGSIMACARSEEPLDREWFAVNYLGVLSQDTAQPR